MGANANCKRSIFNELKEQNIMNAEEYLKGLNEHDPVFEIDTEYEFTEQQLINFAERYHDRKLKILRLQTVIKSYSEQEMDNAYDKGYNDGANAAATDICNSL